MKANPSTPRSFSSPRLGWLPLFALAAAAAHCGGSASDATGLSGIEGTGAGSPPPGRTRWFPGGGTSKDAAGAGGAQPANSTTAGTSTGSSGNGGAENASPDGGPTPPVVLCPNVPRTDQTVTLAVSRARATVSPVQARGALLGDPNGKPSTLPASGSSRLTEFLSYYRIPYGPVQVITASAGLEPGPFVGRELMLQVGVQAPATPIAHPAVITAVVDTSISMTGGGIARARAALAAILASLQSGDRLNLLTAGSAPPRTFAIASPNDPSATSAVASLAVDGGSAFGASVVTAYDMATSSFEASGTNRVVLVSDGSVPTSAVDFGLIAANAVSPGIGVVGVGVGPAVGYDDTVLAYASEAGLGSDVFLDRVEEADVMLHQRFDEVMGVAARSVSVSVTLPWFLSLGAPSDVPPAVNGTGTGAPPGNDLGPGRALVYRQVLEACDPNVIDMYGSTTTDGLITIDVTYESIGGAMTHAPLIQAPIASLVGKTAPQIAKADAIAAFADALNAGDTARWSRATQMVNAYVNHVTAVGNAADPDFTDPKVGIVKLLALEQPLVHP